MLRINLLPPYIYEKRKVNQTIALFIAALLVIVVLMGSVAAGKKHELEAWTDKAADMQKQADAVTALQGEVESWKSKSPALSAKVHFAEDLQKYNVLVPKLYEEVAKYTYNRVVYSSMQLSGNQLTMAAHARTLGDAARYMLNMYHATDIFSNVSVSYGVPGYPGGLDSITQSGGLDMQVSCTLINPIVAPVYSEAASPAAAADAGAGGMPPGIMGGSPGGMKGMGKGGMKGMKGMGKGGMMKGGGMKGGGTKGGDD